MRGYTLVEIVIVIVVLLVLSTSTFVFIGHYRGIKLDAGATKMASDIRYAQSLAMSTAVWHGVVFNVSPANTYSVFSTTGTVDSVVDDPSQPGRPLTVDVSSLFWSEISSVDIYGGGNKLSFNPLGQTYTGRLGDMITVESTVVLSSEAGSKTITVVPNTGKVVIQ